MATYWEIAAHSAYDMFHGIKYLIVSLVFSHLGFWSGNLFLIAPFPDLCLLVPFQASSFMLLLYSLVCVGPGRKPKLLLFSFTGSNIIQIKCRGCAEVLISRQNTQVTLIQIRF